MTLSNKEGIGLDMGDVKGVILGAEKYSSFISKKDMVATDPQRDIAQKRAGVDYSSVKKLLKL